MRSDNIAILQDTLDILDQGSYQIHGKTIPLKLSRAQMEEVEVFLPRDVKRISEAKDFEHVHVLGRCGYGCENVDSFTLARKRAEQFSYDLKQKGAKPVLVLNLANPVNPGGGVRRGAKAQEEDLCRKSSLLVSLESMKAKTYYDYNRSLGTYMGSHALMIHPQVEIIKDENGDLLSETVIVAVMTCAAPMGQSDDEIRAALVASMQKWGRRYPDAGYGGMFYQWLHAKHPKPYGSFGNGSAMRVSSAGWLFDTLEETRHMARLTAEVTHNHPEGIKGAEATACAIYMARTGSSKEKIKDYIIREFGYDLSRTCDEIRPKYHHVETCQKTVPEAITTFLEGTDFEDVIRTAVSLGGDCDTLTCIAGGMAEAFYGVPDDLTEECRKRLPDDMLAVLNRFAKEKASGNTEFHNTFLDGNTTACT